MSSTSNITKLISFHCTSMFNPMHYLKDEEKYLVAPLIQGIASYKVM